MLAFSTNAYVRYTLEEAIRSIARLGYNGVEILADRPHAFLDDQWNGFEALKDALSSSGLAVSNINANTATGFFVSGHNGDAFEPSLSNPGESLRRWRIDYTKRCIDLAAALGCRSVSITSGPVPVSEQDEGQGMDLFIEALREILDYGRGCYVSIGIEYEPGLLIGDAWKTAAILDALQSTYLGVNLDIGHAYVLGEDLREIITMFGSRILNIHIEDIKDRRHFHLIPGLGDIDFDSLIRALKDIDYRHYLTVELYTYSDTPAEAAAEALDFFRKRLPIKKGEGDEDN